MNEIKKPEIPQQPLKYIWVEDIINRVKNNPQLQEGKKGIYTFHCKRCGFTKDFQYKKQIKEYTDIHKAPLENRKKEKNRKLLCSMAKKIEIKKGEYFQSLKRADLIETDNSYIVVQLFGEDALELALTKGPIYIMYPPFFAIPKDSIPTLELANIKFETQDRKEERRKGLIETL